MDSPCRQEPGFLRAELLVGFLNALAPGPWTLRWLIDRRWGGHSLERLVGLEEGIRGVISQDAMPSLRLFISFTSSSPQPISLLPVTLKLLNQLSMPSFLSVFPGPTPVRFLLRPHHQTVLVEEEVSSDPPVLGPTLAVSTHHPSYLFEILPSLGCVFCIHTFVHWTLGPLHVLPLSPGIPFFGYLQGSCAHSFRSLLIWGCLRDAFPRHLI